MTITKIKLLPGDTLQAKVIAGFAGSVEAGDGITVTHEAGVYTVALDADGFGLVVGPGGATDNAVARFNGTTGELIQNSGVIIDDSDVITGGTWQGNTVQPGYGGTGLASYVVGDLLYASTTSVLSRLAASTSGYALIAAGAGAAPAWTGFVPAAGTGATTRTWQSKAQDFINARDYGVVADGATDDTVALQRADDAAVAQRKTLILPAGDINIVTGGITPGANSRWVGQGPSLTTLAINHASNTTFNVSNDGFEISGMTITNFVARATTAKTFNITAGAATYRNIRINSAGTAFYIDAGDTSILLIDDVHLNATVADGFDWDVYSALILSVNNCTSSGSPSARLSAHFRVTHCAGQIQLNNTHCFQAKYGLYSTPGEDQVVTLLTGVASSLDSNSIATVWVVPTAAVGAGDDGQFHRFLWDSGWLGGGTGYCNFSNGSGGTIRDIQITKTKLFPNVSGGVVCNFTGVSNVEFSKNLIVNFAGATAHGATFESVNGGNVEGNMFLDAHNVGFFVTGTTDYLQIHHHNFVSPAISGGISNTSSGTNNRFHSNIGVADTPALAVASGGTGAATLTGLLQGNGTSAVTAITNSTTAGQVLRVTGSNTYGWGALDLSDTDAITGDLPFGNLTQGAALTVLANATNGTADFAALAAGSDHQVLRRSGTALAFGAVNLAQSAAVTGTLPVGNGGTGITSLGAGVATWLGTPSSTNLAAAVTGETGSGALVFATGPALVGPATFSFAPGAAAGSGSQLGLSLSATRAATSGGGTDTYNVIDIGFTDSGSISATQTAALAFTSTYSNANNITAFNLGVKAFAQVTANLSHYKAFYAGATLFGGTLGTYTSYYAQAPGAAGGSVTNKHAFYAESGAGAITQLDSAGIDSAGHVHAMSGTAIPAGGTSGSGFVLSSTSSFGVFFGSGAPTLSAAKGSLYLRSDGSGTNDRMYVNTNGTTTWTAVVTVA